MDAMEVNNKPKGAEEGADMASRKLAIHNYPLIRVYSYIYYIVIKIIKINRFQFQGIIIISYSLPQHADLSEETKHECVEVIVASCEKHPSNHEVIFTSSKKNAPNKLSFTAYLRLINTGGC